MTLLLYVRVAHTHEPNPLPCWYYQYPWLKLLVHAWSEIKCTVMELGARGIWIKGDPHVQSIGSWQEVVVVGPEAFHSSFDDD